MRALIACCTYTWKTMKVANEVKARTGGDITRIQQAREWPAVVYRMQSFIGWKPRIYPCTNDIKGYDTVIICTPSCGSRIPAPVKTYISTLQGIEGKSFAIILTSESGMIKGSLESLKNALESRGMKSLGSAEVSRAQVEDGQYFAIVDGLMPRLGVVSRLATTAGSLAHKAEAKVEKVSRVVKFLGKYGKWMLK